MTRSTRTERIEALIEAIMEAWEMHLDDELVEDIAFCANVLRISGIEIEYEE